MRYFLDTEFIDDGRTIDLISIGLVGDDGRQYYAESSECDLTRACGWVKANVVPHLTGEQRSDLYKTRNEIAKQITAFVGDSPEFWGYFSAYDWVALCQLYGRMLDIPPSWPSFCFDVQQFAASTGVNSLPPHAGQAHNALADAIWTRQAFIHVFRQRAA